MAQSKLAGPLTIRMLEDFEHPDYLPHVEAGVWFEMELFDDHLKPSKSYLLLVTSTEMRSRPLKERLHLYASVTKRDDQVSRIDWTAIPHAHWESYRRLVIHTIIWQMKTLEVDADWMQNQLLYKVGRTSGTVDFIVVSRPDRGMLVSEANGLPLDDMELVGEAVLQFVKRTKGIDRIEAIATLLWDQEYPIGLAIGIARALASAATPAVYASWLRSLPENLQERAMIAYSLAVLAFFP